MINSSFLEYYLDIDRASSGYQHQAGRTRQADECTVTGRVHHFGKLSLTFLITETESTSTVFAFIDSCAALIARATSLCIGPKRNLN